ncbi:MAG: DUF6448 family protein, partial [bacterium]
LLKGEILFIISPGTFPVPRLTQKNIECYYFTKQENKYKGASEMKARNIFALMVIVVLYSVFLLFSSGSASAHCDTMSGPVITDARAALDKGDITPVLKWVRKEDEEEIRNIFQRALTVRKLGTEAKEFADMYFFETLVRIHRAGEGEPYIGLKSGEAEISPVVREADEALETGTVDSLVEHITHGVAEGIRMRFNSAVEKKRHADSSVEAGREFVEAYIGFVHYAEGIYQVVAASAVHHGEEGAPKEEHHH